MKSLISSILLICTTFFVFANNSQVSPKWNKYSVSQTIYTSDLNSKKLLHGKSKTAFENNIADFYLYKNGQLVKPPKDSIRSFFIAGCLCFKFDDTLLLNSGLGRTAGIGVGIKIYKDKFTGSLHGNAGSNLAYKFKKTDTAYLRDINVQPLTQSLKFIKQPDFAPDEVIIGEYNATYKKFYQRVHHKDESRNYTVRLLFKCKITGMDSMKDPTGSDAKQ
jgi:hypothetical protein